MQGDAVSSGFACISRRFSAGLVGSSARKTAQWTVLRENGPAGPRRTGRQTPELSQGKSTQKCRRGGKPVGFSGQRRALTDSFQSRELKRVTVNAVTATEFSAKLRFRHLETHSMLGSVLLRFDCVFRNRPGSARPLRTGNSSIQRVLINPAHGYTPALCSFLCRTITLHNNTSYHGPSGSGGELVSWL